jgi:putative nucleotidyltransferase-like protein
MAEPRLRQSPGELVAHLLYGAWRQLPPELKTTIDNLEDVAPQLLGSGSSGLVWRRINHTDLQNSPAAFELKQAYRLQSLYAGLHEIKIEKVIELLHARQIEPVLLKGRAIADLYPERALRPYGDIDLCFNRTQYALALAALDTPEGRDFNVDPHEELDRLYGLSFDELLASCQIRKVGKAAVRVPCAEHHLRILCIHFLKHGGWRPLSLCDVAAALESRSNDFDWDRCLGKDKLITDWVSCAIGLADKLLGARIEDTPVTPRAHHLPGWLVPAVLKQWETPYPQANETTELMTTHLRRRSGVISAMRKRWPDPIRATVYFRAPFNELPRFPFQLSNYVSQAARFLITLPKALADQQR